MKKIFLVRHGQSLGNVEPLVYRTTPDFAVPLSNEGVEQAKAAGDFLRGRFFKMKTVTPNTFEMWARPRMWVSPYTRARMTADGIEAALRPERLLGKRKEHVLLCEQQFGLMDTVAGDRAEAQETYPDVVGRYELFKEHGGKFWARAPGGESRFDVATRVHQAFGTFHRDYDKHKIENIIVVAHGTTIRAFVMMWLHHPFEWFEDEPNPKNCSVRLLDSGVDRGYIFPGF